MNMGHFYMLKMSNTKKVFLELLNIDGKINVENKNKVISLSCTGQI